jgi:hypothetical protein
VPVVETFCQPVASATNKVGKVPEYIASYVAETNAKNEEYAQNAARLP